MGTEVLVIAYIPLLFAIAGVLVYALVTNSKLAEIGRLVFFAGFLVTMWTLAGHTLHVLAGP